MDLPVVASRDLPDAAFMDLSDVASRDLSGAASMDLPVASSRDLPAPGARGRVKLLDLARSLGDLGGKGGGVSLLALVTRSKSWIPLQMRTMSLSMSSRDLSRLLCACSHV